MTVIGAGFVDFQITWRGDVYSGAPQSSSAAKYGTLGVNFAARKSQLGARVGRGTCRIAVRFGGPPERLRLAPPHVPELALERGDTGAGCQGSISQRAPG